MQALVMVPGTPASLGWQSLPDPEPAPGQVLLRMLAVPLRSVDGLIAAGDVSATTAATLRLGHEGYGVVSALGPGTTGIRIGERVALLPRTPDDCASCVLGEIDRCKSDHPHVRGVAIDGALAELLVASPDELVRVPRSLSFATPLLGRAALVTKAIDLAMAQQRQFLWQPKLAWVDLHEPLKTLAYAHLGVLGIPIGLGREPDIKLLHPGRPAAGAPFTAWIQEDGLPARSAEQRFTGQGEDMAVMVRSYGRRHVPRAIAVLQTLAKAHPDGVRRWAGQRIAPCDAVAALADGRVATVEFAPV